MMDLFSNQNGQNDQIEIPGLDPIEPGRMRYQRASFLGTCRTCDTATIGADYCESCQSVEQSRIDRWNGRRG